MTSQNFIMYAYDALQSVKDSAPRDTGNLADNATKIRFSGTDTAVIYVDENIAYYMPYTNEPWVSSYWQGKQNPNLYWFDFVAEEIVSDMAKKARGRVKRGRPQKLTKKERMQMVRDFQNKRGDYAYSHTRWHSEYISRLEKRLFSARKEEIQKEIFP